MHRTLSIARFLSSNFSSDVLYFGVFILLSTCLEQLEVNKLNKINILWLGRDKSDDDISLASPSYDNYVYSSPRHEDLSLNNTTVASTHANNGKSTDSTSIATNQPTEILAGSCVSKGERLVL